MADDLAILCDQNAGDIYVIDLTTQTILFTSTVATQPGPIAVLPDATEAYIPDTASIPGKLYPLSIPGYVIGSPITVTSSPNLTTASADGSHVYVASGVNGTITPVATPSNVPGPGIVLPGVINVFGIAADPASANLYANSAFGGIFPIAIPADTVGTPFSPYPPSYAGVVVMPDGIHGYLGGGSNVYPVNFVTQTVGSPISVGSYDASQIFLKPGGAEVWFPDVTGYGVVGVIDTATNTYTHTITYAAFTPGDSGCFSNDGSKFFVPNVGGGYIYTIDTATYSLVGTGWNFGGDPRWIASIPVPTPPPVTASIGKLFIPRKGRATTAAGYQPSDLIDNFLAIERWANTAWVPKQANLFIPCKPNTRMPTPSEIDANWLAIERWADAIGDIPI